MPIKNVSQGDCISSIAHEFGLFWETIWTHEKNAELVKKRENPNALLPGDKVFVPDVRQKDESGATTLRHVFRLRGGPVKLNIQLLDIDGNPRVNIPFTLDVDGKKIQKSTNEEGRISELIPATSVKAKLTVRPPNAPVEEYDVDLGFMTPISDTAGVQARLKNLGFYRGDMNGNLDEETLDAVAEFQADAGLSVTRAIDDATRAALNEQHGG